MSVRICNDSMGTLMPEYCEGFNPTEQALEPLERTDTAKRPVRLLGVGVHGLCGVDAARATPESLPLQEDLVL